MIETYARRVFNRIQISPAPAPSIGSSPIPFAASRTIRVRVLFKVDANRRNVGGGRHDVVSHLPVSHAPVFPDDVFEECKADRLGHAAFDLSGCQHRIDHPPDFLHRDKIVDVRFIGRQVN